MLSQGSFSTCISTDTYNTPRRSYAA